VIVNYYVSVHLLIVLFYKEYLPTKKYIALLLFISITVFNIAIVLIFVVAAWV